MALFHQKAARTLIEADDHLILGVGKFESIDVIFATGVWIWKQDHGRGLLDQRSSDIALQCVFRTLRGEDTQAILLADGLLLVLGEFLESATAIEDLPELIHHVD